MAPLSDPLIDSVDAAIGWISDQLIISKTDYGQDATGWVSLRSDNRTPLSFVSNRSLYDGQLGIATFFADLYSSREDGQALITTKKISNPWLSCDISTFHGIDTGIGTGLGSALYAFTRLYISTGQSYYANRAVEIANSIDTEQVLRDTSHDLLYGNAGLLISLCYFEQEFPGYGIEDIAKRVGEDLINKSIEKDTGIGWRTSVGYSATGFAHGASGVAYALSLLGKQTGQSKFLEAASDAIQYENDHYSSKNDEWTSGASSNQHAFRSGWCWGGPGIAISRLGMINSLTDYDLLLKDLHRGLEIAMSQPYDNDTLCHGKCSGITSLVEAGLRYDDRYLDHAEHLIAEMLNQWEYDNRFQLPLSSVVPVGNPSLFTGLAGVGHALLRARYPDSVSSIVLFE